MADADTAQLLGYLMHELAEKEMVLRGYLPVDLTYPVGDVND